MARRIFLDQITQIANYSLLGNATGTAGTVSALTSAQVTALLNPFTTALQGLAPASGGGTINFLRADGTWAPPNSGGGSVTSVSVTTANGVSGTVATASSTPAITLTLGSITPSSIVASGSVTGSNLSGTNTGDQTITLTGNVTGSGTGSFATTIAANAVTNAMLAQVATATFHGRITAATGNVETLTATQATSLLDAFTTTLKGLAPASGGGTTNFLRADGTWVSPPNSGGTVTTVSVTTANGVSGTVSNATTTPAISITLGAITPTSVAASGALSGSNFTGSSSGTNTGDQTITLTGVVTGSGTGSFATSFATSPAFSGIPTAPTATADTNTTQLATTAFVQTARSIIGVTTTGGASTVTQAQAGQSVINITGTLISNATISLGSGTASFYNTSYVINNATTGAFTVTIQACATSPGTSVVITQGTSTLVTINGANASRSDTDYTLFTSSTKGVVAASGGGTTNFLRADGTWVSPPNSGGTVTTVSVATANGVSGTVANPTTTPAITLTLGAITPTSVAASGTVTGSNLSGSSSGTNTGDQTITLTGNVTGSGTGSFATTIAANAVTLANMAQVATGTVFYRKTAATGNPEVQSLATLKTDLGLTGTNSGDQTITLTSDVTGSGTGSFAATISAGVVSLAKMANLAANSIIGNNTGSAATPLALSGTQVTAMLDAFTSSLKGLAPASGGGTTNFLRADGTWVSPPNSGGTVTTVSVTTSNGVSGSVANASTTPAITLTLGAITPTSVAASGALSGSNFSGSSSGTNTGDQTITLTGVVTGSGTGSFATSFAASPAFSGSPTAPTATADTNTTQLATTAFVQTAKGVVNISTTGGASTVTSAQAGQQVINISGTLISNATISFGSGAASFFNTSYVINNATTGAFTVTIQACVTTPGSSVVITQGTSTLVTVNGANASRSDTDYTLFSSTTKGVVSGSGGGTTNFLRADGTWVSPPNSGGTVTTVSVTTANGVSGTVANPTTTPAITVTLGAITPTSVAASGALSGSNFSGSSSGTNTGDQTITLTGNVTGSGTGSFATTIATNAVTLANMAQVATGTVFYRKTAATGNPEVQSLATLKTDLGLTGTNSGDQTISLTGDVTGSGTGSFAATIAAASVTLAKMANLAANSIIGNNTGSAATPLALSGTQVTAMLDLATGSVKGLLSSGDFTKLGNLSGTNTGDQTITLTGQVTGSGTGSFATTLATNTVTLAQLAQVATGTFLARTTGATGNVEALTTLQAKTLMALNNVDNTSDANKPVSTATQTALNLKVDTSTLGAANGVATLDSNSKIPTSQLPALAITSTQVAASQTAQLAIVNQEGDVVVRSDLNKTYIRLATSLGTMADYQELLTPTDAVLSVNGYTGAVNLTSADIGLGNVDNTSDANKPVSTATQTALNLKANLAGATFSGAISATNLSGTNTGDQTITLTGDVTGSGTGSFAATIAAASVTLAKQANFAANSIQGNNTGSAATPLALSGTQVTAMLDAFTSSLKGLAPASGGGTTNFLRADGTWVSPPNSGGTVTTVSVTTANGVSGTVATPSTTPAITISLGAITPTSVAASGAVTGSNLSGTNTGDQTITLTGQVTGSGTGSFATTLATNTVTLAQMAQVATGTVFYRKTAATGNPEVQTLATLKTDLGLTGTNTGDQTIALTGDVTGSGTGSFAATIAAASVSLAKMANLAANSIIGNNTGAGATPLALTGTQVTAMLDAFTTSVKGLAPASGGGTTNFLRADGTWVSPPNSGGTVTTVSVTTTNGVSGSVTNPTTTPAITLTLGAITPTSVAASGALSGSNFSGSSSGTNTGDQTITLTGVVTGSGTGSFATSFAASPAFSGTPTAPTATADTNTTQLATTAFVQASRSVVGITTTGGATTVTQAQAGQNVINITGTLISNATISFGSSTASFFNTSYVINNATTGAFTVTIQACATSPGTSVVITQGTSTLVTVNGANASRSDTDYTVFTSSTKGVAPASGGGTTNFLRADGTWVSPPNSGGTVTTISVATANGVSGSVTNPTTTPAITLTLGAITPTSLAASGTVSGSNLSGTNTGDQTITLTGQVTGTGTGSFATSLATNTVTLAQMAQVATGTVFYRKTAATGNPEVQTLATLKTDLGLTGTNSGDQTITLTSDVTGSGTGSFAATISAGVVSLAKMSNLVANSIIGNNTGLAATPLALSGTQVTAMLDAFTTSLKGLAPASGGGTTNFLRADGTWVSPPNSGGTVTTVSVTTANGVSGSVTNPTTTPAISLTLGAITPTSVAASGTISGSNFSGSSSGTNTGDQTITLTGVVTGSGTGSFATSFAASPAFSGTPTAPTATADINTTQIATTAFVQTSKSVVGITTTGGATTVTQAQAGQSVINVTGTLISNATISFGSSTTSFFNTSYVINNATTGAFTVTIQACATSPGTAIVITQGTSTLVTVNGANAYRSETDYTLFTSSVKGAVPASGGGTTNFLRADGTWVSPPNSGGTVTAVSVATANGVSGSSSGGTTPALTISLGAITPSSVAASGTVTGSNLSGSSSGTNTGDQTITLTGQVTGSGTGSFATTLATNTVTLAQMAQVATGTVFYRKTAATGNPEVQTLATLKTDLGLTGTNSGDQTITLTGDVTGSGTGSFAATIGAATVSLAKMSNLAANSIIGNNTGSSATPIALTSAQVTAFLTNFTSALSGTVPASGGGTTTFLRADGTWATPAGGGGTTTNALTINNSGTGAASGSTFNGGSAVTISYNSIGAAPTASPTLTGTVTIPTPTADTNSTTAASTAYVQNAVGSVAISTTGGATTITNAQAGSEVINITGTLASNATISFGSGSASFFNRAYVINNNTTGAFTLTIQACVTGPGTSVVVAQGRTTFIYVNGANVTTGVNDVASLTINGATLNGTTETLALAGGMAVKLGSNSSNAFTLYGGATNSDYLQTYRSGSLTWNMTTNNGSSVLNINNLSVNMAIGLSLGTTNVALASPGAYLNIDRGITSYAPIRLTTASAALLTTPLSGVIETDGTSLFWTTGAATRYALASTNTFTSSVAGLVPASGGGTTTFLRADGTFAAPPGGSSSFTVVTKTATYTETTTSGEIIILADLVAGFTITLPTAVSNTAKLTIKKMQSAGSIVVNTTSSQTIDGGLTATLTTQYTAITLVSNNSNWVLI